MAPSTITRRQLIRLGTLAAIAGAVPSLAFPGDLAARSGLFPVGSSVTGTAATTVSEAVWADGHHWYKIDAGQVGWVAGTYLQIEESDTPQGLRIQVVEGPLNLRDAPSLSARVITALPVGTTLRVTQADGGSWADGYHWIAVRVEAQNPVEGFVADAFTDPV